MENITVVDNKMCSEEKDHLAQHYLSNLTSNSDLLPQTINEAIRVTTEVEFWEDDFPDEKEILEMFPSTSSTTMDINKGHGPPAIQSSYRSQRGPSTSTGEADILTPHENFDEVDEQVSDF